MKNKKKKKIIITGGKGFLGTVLTPLLKKKYSVYQFCNSSKGKYKFDLTKKNFFHTIYKINPDIIINCAAATNIEFCEKFKKKSYEINVNIVKNLIFVSKKINCQFVHISTDHVYDDEKKFNTENKKIITNQYAKDKLLSERVSLTYKKSMVLRTNFFGVFKKKGNINWVFNDTKKNKKIFLISDVYFSPLYVVTLCKILIWLINSKNFRSGLYNLGAINGISKEKFYKLIFKKLSIKANTQSINLIKFNKIKKMVRRPRKMILNTKKFKNVFNIDLPSVQNQINKFCYDYKNK